MESDIANGCAVGGDGGEDQGVEWGVGHWGVVWLGWGFSLLQMIYAGVKLFGVMVVGPWRYW